METEFLLEDNKEGVITIGKETEETGEPSALHRSISVENFSEATCDSSSCRSAYFEYTGSCEPTKQDGCSFQLQALDNSYTVTVHREDDGRWKKACRYQKKNERNLCQIRNRRFSTARSGVNFFLQNIVDISYKKQPSVNSEGCFHILVTISARRASTF